MGTAPRNVDVAADSRFQHWEWRFQRLGWLLLCGIVAGGLLGLLGDGPLSSVRVVSSDGRLQASFDRNLHRTNPTVIELQFEAVSDRNPIELHVSAEYVQRVRILRTVPAAEFERAESDGIVFGFQRELPVTAGIITFHVEPRTAGSLVGKFTVTDNTSVVVSQFVFP